MEEPRAASELIATHTEQSLLLRAAVAGGHAIRVRLRREDASRGSDVTARLVAVSDRDLVVAVGDTHDVVGIEEQRTLALAEIESLSFVLAS